MANIIGGVTTTPLAMQTIKQKVTDDVSNALKGTKSGEIVTIDDISPLEHNIEVKVEGANHITKSGKNLIPYPYSTISDSGKGIIWTDNGDGTWIVNGTANSASYATSKPFMVSKGTYTFSGHITTQYESDCFIYIATEDLSIRYDLNDGNSKTFTLDKDTEMKVVCRVGTGKKVENHIFKPQLELGTVATEFEPYIEPITYPVNADGSVDGVKSAYPTTVLTADTEGATIMAEYNKDINKTLGDLEILLGGI